MNLKEISEWELLSEIRAKSSSFIFSFKSSFDSSGTIPEEKSSPCDYGTLAGTGISDYARYVSKF